MRILLDENLDWRPRRALAGHQVESVPLLGWAGIQNGELLEKAIAAGFDVLVTMDGHMMYQQNIACHTIAVVALRAKSNRLDNTRPLMNPLLALLPKVKPGTVTCCLGVMSDFAGLRICDLRANQTSPSRNVAAAT